MSANIASVYRICSLLFTSRHYQSLTDKDGEYKNRFYICVPYCSLLQHSQCLRFTDGEYKHRFCVYVLYCSLLESYQHLGIQDIGVSTVSVYMFPIVHFWNTMRAWLIKTVSIKIVSVYMFSTVHF